MITASGEKLKIQTFRLKFWVVRKLLATHGWGSQRDNMHHKEAAFSFFIDDFKTAGVFCFVYLFCCSLFSIKSVTLPLFSLFCFFSSFIYLWSSSLCFYCCPFLAEGQQNSSTKWRETEREREKGEKDKIKDTEKHTLKRDRIKACKMNNKNSGIEGQLWE